MRKLAARGNLRRRRRSNVLAAALVLRFLEDLARRSLQTEP